MEKAQIFRNSTANFSWTSPTENPALSSDEVHIWLARLDRGKARDLLKFLSEEERARAGRFRFERDKNQFIAARGILRLILGKYLKTNPRNLQFEYSEYGKPSIAGNQLEIKFNLSHSENLAIYAFTRKRKIGIDLERVKTDFVTDETIEFCLTPQEIAHIKMLSEARRIEFFFDCWTLKEAYLKASGDGFSISPNRLETSMLSGPAPNFLNSFHESKHTKFSVQKILSIPNYKAALAFEGEMPSLKFWLLN